MPVTAHCPHCSLPLAEGVELPFPPEPRRCPECGLVVGRGRAREDADEIGGSRGAAAGRYASEVRRRRAGEAIDRDDALRAILGAARALGCRASQVRMLDYRELQRDDPELPEVHAVVATLGSWKRAVAAAREAERTAGEG